MKMANETKRGSRGVRATYNSKVFAIRHDRILVVIIVCSIVLENAFTLVKKNVSKRDGFTITIATLLLHPTP
jgi:hypothetical protein